MRRRILYDWGIEIVIAFVALVVWLVPFRTGSAPIGLGETLIFCAVLALIYFLMVKLRSILVRTLVKLWVDHRSHRERSTIKTKLVGVALRLSFIPVFLIVLFSLGWMDGSLFDALEPAREGSPPLRK